MDYACAIVGLVIGVFAIFYHRLQSRKAALISAYGAVNDALKQQQKTISDVVNAARCPHASSVHRHLRRMQAIGAMGLPAIDQCIDVYDDIFSLVQPLLDLGALESVAPECRAFQEGHHQLVKTRALYNRMALEYNDCQRSTVQYWISSWFGHTMAPASEKTSEKDFEILTF